MSEKGFVPTGTYLPVQPRASEMGAGQDSSSTVRPPVVAKEPNPLWVWFKGFMKVHWRITLAIFCTLGVAVMPFAGETVPDKVGGTLMYLVGAIVFWFLHTRHASAPTTTPEGVPSGLVDRLDMTIEDGWSQRLGNCRQKASVFNEVGAATNADSIRTWLAAMSDDIDAQLVQADDLAALGRSIEPGFDGPEAPTNPAAKEAWSRLGKFEAGLADAVTRAAQVRLNSLSPASDLDSIRGQLDMLQSQLPSLDPR